MVLTHVLDTPTGKQNKDENENLLDRISFQARTNFYGAYKTHTRFLSCQLAFKKNYTESGFSIFYEISNKRIKGAKGVLS